MASHSFATSGSGSGCSAIPTDTTKPGTCAHSGHPRVYRRGVRRALPLLLALLSLLVPAAAAAASPAPDRPAVAAAAAGPLGDRRAGARRHRARRRGRRARRAVAARAGGLRRRRCAPAGARRLQRGAPGRRARGGDAAPGRHRRRLPRADRRDGPAARPARDPHARRPAPGPVEPALPRLGPARVDDPRRRPAGGTARAVAARIPHEPRAGPRVPELLGRPAGGRRRRPADSLDADRRCGRASARPRALARRLRPDERAVAGPALARVRARRLPRLPARRRCARLWRRTVAQVRSVDADAITWIEPPALAPVLAPLLLPATGDRRRSGLAFQADCELAALVSPRQPPPGRAGRCRPRR